MSFPDKFYLYNKGTLIYECEWYVLPRLIEAMEKEYQSYIDNGAIGILEKALEDMKAKQTIDNAARGISEMRGKLKGLTELIKKWDQEGLPEQRNEETK